MSHDEGWDEAPGRPRDDAPQEPVHVPWREIEPDTLRRVVESFVLREGTDYGEREYSLEAKVSHVLRQLERGEAHVVYDPNTETVQLVRDARERRAPR